MRTLVATLIGIVMLSAATNPDRPTPPAVSAEAVTIRTVRLRSEMGTAVAGDSRNTLLVARPAGAREGARSSVFALDADGVRLRRITIEYGSAASSLIQIVSGVSAGDRIIVSDMSKWDQFERLQLGRR
jgi:hypothetical protein